MKKCISYIEDELLKYDYPVKKKSTLAETILGIFVGTTGTTRLGPEPSLNTKQEVLRRIQYKLDRNEPFEVSCAWGAIKTVSSDIKSVDLAELLTFSQYAAINRQIKSVYEPGVRFNLYMGDDYYEYLYGQNPKIKNYCKGMCELAKDYEEVNPIYISESVYKIPNVKEVCEKNYELLKEYWNDTTGLEEEQFCTLSSYRRLEEAGWVGIIPIGMRDFYKKRMQQNYTDKNEDFWTEKILRFFAYGLFISQNDLMNRKKIELSTVDSCLLRVPPPGLPRKLYSNRIRMRITPENMMKHSAPPWTVAGAVSINRDGNTHIRIVDSSVYNKVKMEYSEYKGISFGIISEEEFLDAL